MPTPTQASDAGQLLDSAEAHFQAGEWRAALDAYRRHAAQFPPDAHVLRRLGTIAIRLGDAKASAQFCSQSLDQDATHVDTWVDHATALRELGSYDEASTSLQHALDRDPRSARAWRFLGIVRMESGAMDDAIAAWKRSIELNPRFTRAWGDLGMLYGDLGRIGEAFECFESALAVHPDEPRSLSLKAELQLLAGDYANGWKSYEARFGTAFRVNADRKRIVDRPRWTGVEPLAGRTILVHPEVGLGDFLMFARYIPMLERLGARVIVYCEPTLADLFRSSFPAADFVMIGAPLPGFDYQCPIMSLPLAFGTTLGSIPSQFPYLRVDPARQAKWNTRLGPRHALRIGLVWANEPRAIDRSPLRRRGMALADIEPLLALPFEFHVLQKDVSALDREALRTRARVRLHDNALADFEDTAALVQLMDTVVTIDTSVAHVAAALARPTHVLLPPACDYRWTRTSSRSPWYATATLHRRELHGTWSEPVETIRNLLVSGAGAA